MSTVPIALDELIISDGRSNNDWLSVIPDIFGLTQAQIAAAQRAGRHPVATGSVLLQRRPLTLETYFPGDDQEGARDLLLEYLNYERGETRRLILADDVLPGAGGENVAFWMRGDIYNDSGTWKIRDLLQPDDVEGTLSGGWRLTSDGLQIAEGTTNLEPNPSFENGTSGWFVQDSNTIAQSSDVAYVGEYSAKCTWNGASSILTYKTISATAADYTVSARIWVPDSWDNGRIVLSIANFSGSASIVEVDWDDGPREQWVTIYATSTIDAGDTSGTLNITTPEASTAGQYFYLDAVQFEQSSYMTPYCDGSLGEGHSWSGTAHNSTSSRTAAQLEHDNELGASGTVSLWVKSVHDSDAEYFWTFLEDASDFREFSLKKTDQDKIRLYVSGTDIYSDDALGWGADTWHNVVVTWNDGSASIYVDGQPAGSGSYSGDPSYGAKMRFCASSGQQINGWLRDVLILDCVLTAGEVNRLYNAGDLNPRWLNVMCNGSSPLRDGRRVVKSAGIASLITDGDALSRQRQGGDLKQWTVLSSGDTATVNNRGTGYAYPIFRITPETAKSSGFTKRRWVPIKYGESFAISSFPVEITDGGIDLSADAQGDGDDIRVYLGSTEIDRWLDGTLVSAVKIWCNLDFSADVSMTLDGAITSGETVTSITVNEDIADLDYSGILLIDSEAFTYEGFSEATKTITITGRAARDTSAAAHSDGSTVYWIQNDLWIYYGDASLSTPTTDDTNRPRFDLGDSSNTEWVYKRFGADDGDGIKNWSYSARSWGGSDEFTKYTGNHTGSNDPWSEAGTELSGMVNGDYVASDSTWSGPTMPKAMITSVDWDLDYNITSDVILANLYVELAEEDVASALTRNGSWQDGYTKSQTITATDQVTFYVSYQPGGISNAQSIMIEVNEVTLGFDASLFTISVNSAEDIYQLDCTITNNETGESLSLNYNMALDDTLVVDTNERNITCEGAGALTAKTLDEARLEWLPLKPGDNELEFTESGLQKVQVDIYWDVRTVE